MSEYLTNSGKVRLVLKEIAIAGYEKTSMQHIAQVLGVSRQTVYKRFNSKAEYYTCLINSYLSSMYLRIFCMLDNDTPKPLEALKAVFELFIIDAVELVNQEHGKKVLDDALQLNKYSPQDWTVRFVNRLGEFLFKHNLTNSISSGVSIAFVLIMASKGVLLDSDNKQISRGNIDVILKVVLKT